MPEPTSPSHGPAIEVRGVVKRYGTVEALKGIDLTVERGGMFALLGPNGAGKTTLFSILATLRSPSEGTASVLGFDVVSQRNQVRGAMGIVFQEPALERRLSGRENLFLMGLFYGLSHGQAKKRAAELISELKLDGAADRPAENLSGGQRRKLELARALVSNPQILFLDEATLGLDVEGRRSFWGHVRTLTDQGRTVFFTTHYMEEAEVADRIALIDAGQIVALDSPRALKGRLGGGVITLQTEDDVRAKQWLTERGFTPEGVGQCLIIVHPDPAAVVPEILRNLPVRVQRVEMHEPSLEDVFLKLTGRGLAGEEPVAPRGSGRGPS